MSEEIEEQAEAPLEQDLYVDEPLEETQEAPVETSEAPAAETVAAPPAPTPTPALSEEHLKQAQAFWESQGFALTKPEAAPAAPVVPTPAPVPKQGTPEYDELFGVWKPDESLLHQLLGEESTPETRLKALAAMRDGISQQSNRTLGMAIKAIQEDYTKQFQEVQKHILEQREAALQNQFFERYPAFRGKEGLVALAKENLQKEGFSAKNPVELFDKLASVADGIIRMAGAPGLLGATQQTAAPMPRTTTPPANVRPPMANSQEQWPDEGDIYK